MKAATFAFALTTLALLATSTAADAARVDHREARQDARIDAGVAHGQLTRCEAVRLERRTDRVAASEAAYRHSGAGLGPRERRDLERRQDSISADIAEQRRDGRGCY